MPLGNPRPVPISAGQRVKVRLAWKILNTMPLLGVPYSYRVA